MKTVKKLAAQGDVLFVRVDRIPAGAAQRPKAPGEPTVVAHSETGHHHSIHDDGVTVYDSPDDPLVCYLRVEGASFDVVHHRPFDTHEPLRCLGEPGAIWQVRRQREHTPEGWRRVED